MSRIPGARFVVPVAQHNALVAQAFRARGFAADEVADAVACCESAARHGIHTHNAIKALHLDDLFGSRVGGCQPGAEIARLPSPFRAVQRWDAKRKLGQAVARAAMAACMEMADDCGVGVVTVDNAFHYLWGGGYVLDAAERGYIAYTCCTAGTAEVVPFQGRAPTMGTNPHSWAFPTTAAIGHPVCIDWATSVVAMGRVQQAARDGATLPPGAAVDADGRPTTDPRQAKWLRFFGEHKGFGLALVNELLAAFTGCGLPSLRGAWDRGPAGEKRTPCFFFQCIRPDALACGDFPAGRDQQANVRAVLADICGHGNEAVSIPGAGVARAAAATRAHGGLLFTAAELDTFAAIAADCGAPAWDRTALRVVAAG